MVVTRLKNKQFSTAYKEKLFMSPTLGRAIRSKPGKRIIEGTRKVLESPGYKSVDKTVKAVKKTIGLIPQNPGRAVRRATAGTIINPALSVAEAGDVALSVTAPVYNAIPVNLKMATPFVAGVTKTPKPVQRVGRDMMRTNGSSRASRFGNRLEYLINKPLLKLSEIGTRLPMPAL